MLEESDFEKIGQLIDDSIAKNNEVNNKVIFESIDDLITKRHNDLLARMREDFVTKHELKNELAAFKTEMNKNLSNVQDLLFQIRDEFHNDIIIGMQGKLARHEEMLVKLSGRGSELENQREDLQDERMVKTQNTPPAGVQF